MKKLKISKSLIVTFAVFIAIFFALGIVLLLLPDDVFKAMGDSNPDIGRYVFFILCEFMAFIFLISVVAYAKRQKRVIAEYNALRDECGENDFFCYGYFNSIEKDHTEAKKNAISIFFATLSAFLFGVGVFSYSTKNPNRLFLLSDEGLYVIFMPKNETVLLKKGSLESVSISEDTKGIIKLACPAKNAVFTFKTKNSDVGKDELMQKLNELFLNRTDEA